ncbi:hypothetical protein N1851_005154 [Merluccius polli]|uniref:DUF5641 domain-containing protein n=1 Tax=Merluccius polli TaxID=89951 RepID=A0AA47PAG2_MERPO|nr:hypothetical protein N1851_005154 [Merluccius polli]
MFTSHLLQVQVKSQVFELESKSSLKGGSASTLLQERQKWNQEKRSFVPGDLVMVADSTAPQGSWMLGRVLETFPDKRGLARVVRLKTNIIERPITKICLLNEAKE